jgi:hypothetical protein
VLACSHISAWPLYLLWQESTYSQKPMNVLARVRSGKSLTGVPFLQSPLHTDPGVRHILYPVREDDVSILILLPTHRFSGPHRHLLADMADPGCPHTRQAQPYLANEPLDMVHLGPKQGYTTNTSSPASVSATWCTLRQPSTCPTSWWCPDHLARRQGDL